MSRTTENSPVTTKGTRRRRRSRTVKRDPESVTYRIYGNLDKLADRRRIANWLRVQAKLLDE